MKIAFFPSANPTTPYLMNLQDELQGTDVEVRPSDKLRFGWLRQNRDLDVLHIHWLQGYTDDRRTPVALLKFIYFTLWVLAAKNLYGMKLVWTLHNLYPHEMFHPKLARAARLFLAKRASRLIVHCEGAKVLAQREFGVDPAKLAVTPHPNWIGKYPSGIRQSEARERLGIGAGTRVFLFLGLIRSYKGVQELIRAYRDLPPGDNLLLVAGKVSPDELKRELEELAAGRDDIRLRFQFIPDEELQTYYAAADVAVLPFQEVLTSGSVLLAMSYGTTVIVPNRGCIGELIDDANGIVYDPDRPYALLQALQEATARDLSEMGQRAYDTAATYSWAAFGDQHRELFLGLRGRK